MTSKAEREEHYRAQNGLRATLTPAQVRRSRHKLNHQIAQQRAGRAQDGPDLARGSLLDEAGMKTSWSFKDIHGVKPLLPGSQRGSNPDAQPVWRGMSRRLRMRRGGRRNG